MQRPWLQLPPETQGMSNVWAVHQDLCGEGSFTPWWGPGRAFVMADGQAWKNTSVFKQELDSQIIFIMNFSAFQVFRIPIHLQRKKQNERIFVFLCKKNTAKLLWLLMFISFPETEVSKLLQSAISKLLRFLLLLLHLPASFSFPSFSFSPPPPPFTFFCQLLMERK